MAKYGITWWGQQWLNSLTRIDFSNRLPRGRNYAGKGAVSKIAIEGNKISAKVKGSRPRPYDVEITIPVFTAKQNVVLTGIIRDNPQLLSRLLNRELDSSLDTLALKEGIHIFPGTWKDFGMRCSCPDWAVPCKHLAAVLYLVANEIDKNPFILFNLHGIDLLEQFTTDDQAQTATEIEAIDSLLLPENNKTETGITLDARKLINIDLSGLSASPPDILALLSPVTVFSQVDFKKLLQNASASLAGKIKNPDIKIDCGKLYRESKVVAVFDKSLSICAAEISNESSTIQVSIEMLVSILSGIEDKELEFCDASWICLHKIYLVSLQLASNKLYYPRLWKAGKDHYLLKYLPATFCDEVRSVFEKLAGSHTRIVEVRTEGKKRGKPSVRGIENQEMILSSVFLGHFMKESFNTGRGPALWDDKRLEQEVARLFINGYARGFDSFETERIPLSINQWLSVFNIHSRKFTPVLKVEEVVNGFGLSILVSENKANMTSPVSLADIFRLKKYDSIRLDILKDMSLVGNYLPQVNALLSTKGKEDVVVSLPDFSVILSNVLPLVKLLGVKVLLPKSLKNLVHPRLFVQINNKSGKKQVSIKSLVGLTELLEYNWQVTLGDDQIEAREFLKLVRGLHGLIKLKDRYIFLDENGLKSLQKNLERNEELTPTQLLQATITGELPGMKAGLAPEVIKMVKELLKESPIELPKDLLATLRPYQQRGFEWLVRNAGLGMGSIIADDMGLGKTLQIICLLLHYKNQGSLISGKALIVVPTTLISNWEHEIERFAPSLSAYAYHGTGRKNDFDSFDIIISSYGLIRNNTSIFEKSKWKLLIVDEAQNIKNHLTEQTKAIKKIKAEIRVAMSGTPVENRLSDYWSIFDFVNKGYLGSFNTFNEEFAKPIHYNHNTDRIEQFKRITSPFLLRRVKTDKSIISDLPDKVERNHYTSLTAEQAALYQSIVDQTISQIERSEGIERRGLVLKLMIALKQTGNHPYHYLRQGGKEPELSGKSQLMAELIKNITDSGEKVIVFTQFREMGDLLSIIISHVTGIAPLFLHGGCSRKQRDMMTERFQNGHNQVYILSLKAGGTGLNLTSANHVIHYDLWWNPAVETQATDRAYRIGQKKNVQVYRLINKGTIEEKIDNMIKEKRYLADLTVTSGETWLGNLSDPELRNLVRLD